MAALTVRARRHNFLAYFSGMRVFGLATVTRGMYVAFDLDRKLLYVAFNEFFMFQLAAGLSS